MRMCSLSDSTVHVISTEETYNEALNLSYTASGFPSPVMRLQLESHYTYTRVGLHPPNGTGVSQRRWNSFQRSNFNTGGQILLSITHGWLSQWFQWEYSGVSRAKSAFVTWSRCEKSKHRLIMSISFLNSHFIVDKSLNWTMIYCTVFWSKSFFHSLSPFCNCYKI